MTDSRPILADYVRFGWALVPIPLGRKSPVIDRWNQRDMCITDPDVAEFIDGNIGLAHAYSGTCAIDVDDIDKTRTWLAERGINLDTLLNAPDAVRIESRPGRAKLLYRVAKPLPSFKVANGGLELRCASREGLTVQDVLPPSIHPDTGMPYTWRYGAGVSQWNQLPHIPDALLSLWQSLIPRAADKPTNANAKSTRAIIAAAPGLAQLLNPLDPDATYDDWLRVGMALHHETQGRPEGLALWNEWSAAGSKYKGIGDLETHWRSFRLDVANPVTLASLRTEVPAAPDEFPDMTAPTAPGESFPPAPLPAAPSGSGLSRVSTRELLQSVRRTKAGTIEPRLSNVAAVLGIPQIVGLEFAYDTFLDAVMVSEDAGRNWRAMADTDYVELRVLLETTGNCEPIAHEMIRDAVMLVADRSRKDSAQEWLTSLRWDGVERVERFCPDYLGTEDCPYTRAVGLYMWTAFAGRVMDPGCQADMVPTIISDEGLGKTRGIQAIVPAPEHYVVLKLDEPDDMIARKCRGVLVAEFAEMRGLRAADAERVKEFVTRTSEKWIPKYREFSTTYPRRFLIVGSTNDEEFLPAETGRRRWLPVHTTGVAVEKIRADRDQLWAEALIRWQVDGVAWQGIDKLAAPARDSAQGEDPWAEDISAWIAQSIADGGPAGLYVKMRDVLVQAVGLDPRQYTRTHELRAARVLRELGYTRQTIRENGRVQKVWVSAAY